MPVLSGSGSTITGFGSTGRFWLPVCDGVFTPALSGVQMMVIRGSSVVVLLPCYLFRRRPFTKSFPDRCYHPVCSGRTAATDFWAVNRHGDAVKADAVFAVDDVTGSVTTKPSLGFPFRE